MTFALVLMFVIAFSLPALANPACAVCTIAVGASLEIARHFGVDDSVVGVWAGAFLTLLGFWMVKWFDKKGWNFKGRDFWLISLSVAMIGFLYIGELTYSPKPILIFYLDPFLFSVIVGTFALIWSSDFYQWMKAKNGGHAHFPFEKVFVPVATLALISLWFYYNPLCAKAPDDLMGFMQ